MNKNKQWSTQEQDAVSKIVTSRIRNQTINSKPLQNKRREYTRLMEGLNITMY